MGKKFATTLILMKDGGASFAFYRRYLNAQLAEELKNWCSAEHPHNQPSGEASFMAALSLAEIAVKPDVKEDRTW